MCVCVCVHFVLLTKKTFQKFANKSCYLWVYHSLRNIYTWKWHMLWNDSINSLVALRFAEFLCNQSIWCWNFQYSNNNIYTFLSHSEKKIATIKNHQWWSNQGMYAMLFVRIYNFSIMQFYGESNQGPIMYIYLRIFVFSLRQRHQYSGAFDCGRKSSGNPHAILPLNISLHLQTIINPLCIHSNAFQHFTFSKHLPSILWNLHENAKFCIP